MRIVLSYLLLITLALSGLTGSVETAHAYTLADALSDKTTQQLADVQTDTPCHSNNAAPVSDSDHDCCDAAEQPCQGDCCAKHCATSGALLATELFRYIRPVTVARHRNSSLPLWLFADEPPPPINA